MWFVKNLFVVISSVFILVACGEDQESTKAASSSNIQEIRRATTSSGLSKADLAQHAQNTYGWDCGEVVSKGEMTADGYYNIECTSGKKFRVYPKPGQDPKITNASGGFN